MASERHPDAGRERPHQMLFRVTTEEREEIRDAARAARVSLSGWILSTLLGEARKQVAMFGGRK